MVSLIAFVIGLNIAIALLGFYLTWRIWQVKRALTATTVVLTAWERQTHEALDPSHTPEMILRGQQAAAFTRQRYVRLQQQIHQLQRIFMIALLVLRTTQRFRKGRRR